MKTFNELINEFAIEMARKNAPISGIELANEEGLEKIGLTFLPRERIKINSKNNEVHITSIWTKEGQVFLSVKKEETPNNEEPILPSTFGVEYCFLEMNGLSVKVMYRLTTPVGFGLWSEYTFPYKRITSGQTLSEIVEEQAKEQIKKDVQEIVAEDPSFATAEEAVQTMFQNFTVVELELVPKGTK